MTASNDKAPTTRPTEKELLDTRMAKYRQAREDAKNRGESGNVPDTSVMSEKEWATCAQFERQEEADAELLHVRAKAKKDGEESLSPREFLLFSQHNPRATLARHQRLISEAGGI